MGTKKSSKPILYYLLTTLLFLEWAGLNNTTPPLTKKKREVTFNSKYYKETYLGYSLVIFIYSLGY